MRTPISHRLMALIRNNQTAKKAYSLQTSEAEATVYVYDVIDPFWGVSASQFVKDLSALTQPTIHLRINSPGGDVFEARAMATAIRGHKSKIVAHIDGLAASAASYIATAAAEVEISDGAFLMIHQAWSIAGGNAGDFRAMADLLEKIDAELVREYAAETGQSAEQIAQWMAAETWMTADEAIANGFADRKAAEFKTADAHWNLDAYDKAPAALRETPAPEAKAEAPVEPETFPEYDAAVRLARTL